MPVKLFSFGIRAVISVALAVTALAFNPATPAAAAWLSPEKQLTTNAAYTGMPDISGTKVVYSDYRNQHEVGDPDDPDILYDIRVLDLTPHVSGTLMTAGSLPIAGKQVKLQYSSNGSTWHTGTTAQASGASLEYGLILLWAATYVSFLGNVLGYATTWDRENLRGRDYLAYLIGAVLLAIGLAAGNLLPMS